MNDHRTEFAGADQRCGLTRRVTLYAAAVLCFWIATASQAQTLNASQWQNGTVNLARGRTHEGDDMRWAQLGFDDSGWASVDLENLGRAQQGWRWYRVHFKLAAGHAHERLLIVGGEGVYQAYVNGQPVADTGLKPWFSLKQPVEKIIPLADDTNDFTLALRTHADYAYIMWNSPTLLNVTVGTSDAIENKRAALESQRLYEAFPSFAINLLLMLAGIGTFALFWNQRSHKEYLWLGLYLLLMGLSNGILYGAETSLVPIAWCTLLADPLIYIFTVMQIEFTFSFAGRPLGRAWRAYEYCLLLILLVVPLEFLGTLSNQIYLALEGLMILPAAVLLPILLLVWYRRGNREAGWLILPSLLPNVATALADIGTASQDVAWGRADFLAEPFKIGPLFLQLPDVGSFLFVLAIGAVMFFRFTRVSREQSRVAAELDAARELQQRMVPKQLPEFKGYKIETAYIPALEVGGDFYQVFERTSGPLLVVGDVSGKGLNAAMRGTLAIGALQTLAAEGLGPGEVLTRLNTQLANAGEVGFITCICMQLNETGGVTVANAGHLAPYCDGAEIAVDTDLPLGIAADETYRERHFDLRNGERLTLMSDGVVEARNAGGELFGFDRTQAVCRQSAGQIAQTALDFGQEDDITVLTVLRNAIA
ncbi:MAG: serine/threonine-protein phosphatase [Acidobacteriota bacterium]|nr:serine/threonine-protein phosphatase [Acidobacteriota bacterium]